MTMESRFKRVFQSRLPVIGCIHLLPLPGSPLYAGNMDQIFDRALEDLSVYAKNGLDGVIVENFRDMPFYPDRVPPETIAAMAAVTRQIRLATHLPVGVNVLRNDAEAAMAVAACSGSNFIRVNLHMHAALTDQGILEGRSYLSMRLRKNLKSECLVLADLRVKHAVPLAPMSPELEIKDLEERGLIDGFIVSGSRTGATADFDLLETVKKTSGLPCLIGSGMTSRNLDLFMKTADGFIIGSSFKSEGKAMNDVDPARVKDFMGDYRAKMQQD